MKFTLFEHCFDLKILKTGASCLHHVMRIMLPLPNRHFVTTFVNVNVSPVFGNDIIVYGIPTAQIQWFYKRFQGIFYDIFQWNHTKMQE